MANSIMQGEWDWQAKGGGFGLPDFGGIFNKQYLPAIAVAFSSGLKAFGAIGQGNAMVEAAKRRQQAAEYEAQQLQVNAGQAKAAAQREAYWKGLEGEQLISAIRARAGAGGTDPTVLNIIGQAMARRAYNMQASLYGGEEKARLMTMQAQSKRYDAELGLADARAGRKGAYLTAVGHAAEGAASLYSKYWPKEEAPGVIAGMTEYEDGDSPVYVAQGGDYRNRKPTSTTGVRA